jgi:demethylmenaquinone methyltransferase/2-methoxy-6-polyprenyl-1,4-benzoquinol methylase
MKEIAQVKEIQKNNPSRLKVRQMFDRIAGRYDLINHLLSFRQDIRWRRRIAQYLPERSGLRLLDVATGTADQIITLYKTSGNKIASSCGVDMSEQMLAIGRKKMLKNFPEAKVDLKTGDAIALPFNDCLFDIVTISFGIRNVTDVNKSLQEMFRVLRPSGRLLILEFSLPQNYFVKKLYLFYFRYILPWLGGIISGDLHAYRYLNETVETFPYGKDFAQMIRATGFSELRVVPLTCGIASIYCAEKNK